VSRWVPKKAGPVTLRTFDQKVLPAIRPEILKSTPGQCSNYGPLSGRKPRIGCRRQQDRSLLGLYYCTVRWRLAGRGSGAAALERAAGGAAKPLWYLNPSPVMQVHLGACGTDISRVGGGYTSL